VPDRRGREDSRRPGLRSGAGSAQTIFVGAVAVAVERAVLAGAAAGGGPRLRVDLGAGLATFGEVALPLSASELVWLAHLAAARRRGDGEGWVPAGRDGHAALRPARVRPRGQWSRPIASPMASPSRALPGCSMWQMSLK
jgi:hypothetical protein